MSEIIYLILLIGILLLVSPLLYIAWLMDSDLDEHGYNIYNSSLTVNCNAKEKCDWRFSTSCKMCKHNCGMKTHSSFKPRKD